MSTSTFHSSANAREFSLPAIELKHVSVSQLLGRDYIFIDTQRVGLPMNNSGLLHTLLDNLIAQLELAEAHTVAISVYELAGKQVGFTRHDLTWHQNKICHVENTVVTQPEQYEFMEMIWRCSSPAYDMYFNLVCSST